MRHSVAVAVVAGIALPISAACGPAEPGPHLSEPIIHIGANVEDPRLMETAILVVIRAPFATVRDYVSDPANVRSYLAFVTESHAEPPRSTGCRAGCRPSRPATWSARLRSSSRSVLPTASPERDEVAERLPG